MNFSRICFDCPKGMFDLGQQKCILCPDNQYIDPSTSECKDCTNGELSYQNGISKCRLCEKENNTFYNETVHKC